MPHGRRRRVRQQDRQKARAEPKSLEMRQRIETLLKLTLSSPEQLRRVRAVEVLQASASPAAKQLLQELAKGAPVFDIALLTLLLLVRLYAKGDEMTRPKIYEVYLKNTRFINNWDLVDSSAEHIVGAFLWDRERKPIYRIAK